MFRYLRPWILMVLASASCGRLVYEPDGGVDRYEAGSVDTGVDQGATGDTGDIRDTNDAADSAHPTDAIDAVSPPDVSDAGSRVTVSRIDVPQLVYPGSTVQITISFTGPANAVFRFVIAPASAGGSFDPFEGRAALDAFGSATVTVLHTAPLTIGEYEHRVVIDSGAAHQSFRVVVDQRKIGYPDPQPRVWGTGFTEGKLMALSIHIDEPVTLVRFGLRADSTPAGTPVHCRMALYENAGILPYQQRIVGPDMLVTQGVNEGVVPAGAPNSSLPSGDYWLAAVCDARFTITAGSNETPYYYMTADINHPLPQTFDIRTGRFNFQTLAFYIVVAN